MPRQFVLTTGAGSTPAHRNWDRYILPTFEVQSMRLLKRLTLMIRDGVVEHVWYPVFPPDRNASQVLDWLVAHQRD